MRSLLLLSFGAVVVAGCSQAQQSVPLFNGHDLDGWDEIGSTGAWTVVDGVLYCDGQKSGYAWLSTERMYGDFVLTLEWKISKGGNSGVFCRVPDHESRASMAGFEVQIIDDTDMKLGEEISGSIFARKNAMAKAANPVGDWNLYIITVQEGHVEVDLNGTVVNEFDFDDYENMKNIPPAGYIGLQNHGSPVWFRNIRIRELQAFGPE